MASVTEIVVPIIILVVIGVAGFLVYWFVIRNRLSSTPAETASQQQTRESSVTLASQQLNQSRYPMQHKGAREERENSFESKCEMVEGGLWHCDAIEDENHANVHRPPIHNSERFVYEGMEGDKHVFRERPNDMLVAPLLNVTGAFDTIQIVTGQDDWSRGFDPGTEMNMDEMLDNVRATSLMIVGSEALPSTETFPTGRYEFDVNNGSTFKGSTLPAGLEDVMEEEKRNGILRMSIRFLDYHFRLDGAVRTVRIAISVAGAQMGDIMLKDETSGIFRFLDESKDVLVADRPTQAASMWNRPGDQDHGAPEGEGEGPPPEGKEPEGKEPEHRERRDEEKAREQMLEATQRFSLPLPIDLSEKPHWEDYQNSALIDLILDGQVGFHGQKGKTGLSDVDILKTFTIQTIGLRAALVLG